MSESNNDRAMWLAATEGVQPLKSSQTPPRILLQRRSRQPVKVIVRRPKSPLLATWVVTKPLQEVAREAPPRPATERDLLRLTTKFNNR